MIAAPVGTKVDGYTLQAACGAQDRYGLCLTHGLTFPGPQEAAQHLQKAPRKVSLVGRGTPPCFMAALCVVHGPEASK